ncbi:MAG TPA: hypothetical protein EYG95_00845 [Campylobacterales bacterium]|nr:hypothetical protein [Campylobacterales bacterium]
MKYIVIIIFVINLSTLFAKGVSAGTVIQNSATLSFSVKEETFSIESNVEKSVVAQLMDTKVSWMDTRAVLVSQGEREKVLTYRVINNGNGKDRYNLLVDELDYKSAFALQRKKVYLDTNDNFRFDSSDRESKTVTLEADKEQLVFVVSGIDKKLLASSGSQNFVNLKAVSQVGGSGERGTVHKGKGVDGVDAVDGFSGGMSEDEGSYKLIAANVILKKNVTINPEGLISVILTVTVGGEGSVNDVNIVDEIPFETIYVNGSLSLDTQALSDRDDNDAGVYKGEHKKVKAQVLVSLGELDVSSYHTITYNLMMKVEEKV